MHIRDIHFPKMALSILSPEYKMSIYNIACNLVQSCSSITTDESGYIIPRQIKKNKTQMGPATKAESIVKTDAIKVILTKKI